MVYTLAGELAEKIGNLQAYFNEDGNDVIP
jgi:hypothetical protein